MISPRIRASLGEVARAWFVIGSQSIGGGPSALFLMRRELIDRRRWLTHREFLEDWALSKISLGINQIALTGLEGMRVAGASGVAVAVASYVIPAAVITGAMTAVYGLVRDDAIVRAALAGAGPAAAGMAVGNSYLLMQGAVRRGWRGMVDRGYWLVVAAVGVLLGVTPILAILAGGIVGLLFLRGEGSRASGTETA